MAHKAFRLPHGWIVTVSYVIPPGAEIVGLTLWNLCNHDSSRSGTMMR